MASNTKQGNEQPGEAQKPAAGAVRTKSPTVTVVIPTLNEADNLPYVLDRIPEGIQEVLVVDGHSTDGTLHVACDLRPNVRLVQQRGRGKGNALRNGFASASGDIIVMLDADGSTDPGEIPAFVGNLLAGADFAKGSRFMQGAGTADMTFIRMLGNWGLTMMVRILFGGRYTDLLYGYNAFWRRVLPIMNIDSSGFEVETQMNIRVLRAGLKVAEVPSFEAARIHGVGRLQTLPDGWRVLKTIVKERLRTQPKLSQAELELIDPGKDAGDEITCATVLNMGDNKK